MVEDSVFESALGTAAGLAQGRGSEFTGVTPMSFAYVRHGEPIFTFALLDPNDHSLNPGLSNLFADGVTFAPGINLPAKYFGKTAKHSFGAAVTTKKYTPFDAIRQAIIPGPPIRPVQPERAPGRRVTHSGNTSLKAVRAHGA